MAVQWSSLPPGKFCAKCGCSCEAHETEEELAKRVRIDAILKKKQEEAARSKASRLLEEEAQCRRRVSDAAHRRTQCDESGEYIRETSLDFITQVKRGPCLKAPHCPGFKVSATLSTHSPHTLHTLSALSLPLSLSLPLFL